MKKTDFTKALTAYFSTYLPLTCGVSPNTCNSYRDAFKLLLLYFQEEKGVPANSIELRMLNRNLVSDFLKLPFGNNQNPSWEDYLHFLESRCIPRTRAGLREYLETIGVDHYDPLEIIRKTQGRMAEDDLWLTVEEIK